MSEESSTSSSFLAEDTGRPPGGGQPGDARTRAVDAGFYGDGSCCSLGVTTCLCSTFSRTAL